LATVEPYTFVEEHGEALFWKYLGHRREQVRNIIIVGAWQGTEIPGLLHRYPQARVFAFEPSHNHFPMLEAAYAGHPRVACFQEAISDVVGRAVFHEGSLPGTGSLLPFGQDEQSIRHNRGLIQTEVLGVETSTLDEHQAIRDLERVDFLKIDVQGAEEAVIRGGRRLLTLTSAVLIEVALKNSAYVGAAQLSDIDAGLVGAGLTLCSLGVDPVTLDGNALYVRVSGRT
jgi:FkbM family methyltransferase